MNFEKLRNVGTPLVSEKKYCLGAVQQGRARRGSSILHREMAVGLWGGCGAWGGGCTVPQASGPHSAEASARHKNVAVVAGAHTRSHHFTISYRSYGPV